MGNPLAGYDRLDIDWDMSPEDAVTMYLEWGNNNWRAGRAPVRGKSDTSTYFVVDSWESPPQVRLIRRDSEKAEELVTFPLPEAFLSAWEQEYASLRGVFAPPPAVKAWLRHLVDDA